MIRAGRGRWRNTAKRHVRFWTWSRSLRRCCLQQRCSVLSGCGAGVLIFLTGYIVNDASGESSHNLPQPTESVKSPFGLFGFMHCTSLHHLLNPPLHWLKTTTTKKATPGPWDPAIPARWFGFGGLDRWIRTASLQRSPLYFRLVGFMGGVKEEHPEDLAKRGLKGGCDWHVMRNNGHRGCAPLLGRV